MSWERVLASLILDESHVRGGRPVQTRTRTQHVSMGQQGQASRGADGFRSIIGSKPGVHDNLKAAFGRWSRVWRRWHYYGINNESGIA